VWGGGFRQALQEQNTRVSTAPPPVPVRRSASLAVFDGYSSSDRHAARESPLEVPGLLVAVRQANRLSLLPRSGEEVVVAGCGRQRAGREKEVAGSSGGR